MARGDQLARQWTIIQNLLASRRGKTIAELAESLECHRRTVYRDLEALQSAGFPLYSDLAEGRSRWSLIESARQSVPIPFSMTELMALYFSRDLLRVLENTVFHESLESLFRKVKATLPPETGHYLETYQRTVRVGAQPHKTYGAFRETIDLINQSIIAQNMLRIDYFTMSRKRRSSRRVAPYHLWFFDGSFYLIAYCYRRKDVRVFAVDRIRSIDALEESFRRPDEAVVDSFMETSFGVFRGENVRVKVWFSPKVAGYIREKNWHATQKLSRLENDALLFEAEVAGTEEIKHWIMQWGSQAVVLSPDTLRTEIQTEAAALLQRYAGGMAESEWGKP